MPGTGTPSPTVGASNIVAFVAQKTPIVSSAEGFDSFVESAHGLLNQRRGLSPVPTPSPADQAVAARPRKLASREPDPADPITIAGRQQPGDPSDAPAPAIAISATPHPSKIGAKPTVPQNGSHDANNSCEKAKASTEAIDAPPPTQIVSPTTDVSVSESSPTVSPQAMSAPPSSVASTQVTDGPAAEQAVGPAADGRKKLSLDSASSSGDEATIAQPNAPLPPQSDPLPAQMAAKASTPLAPARPAEKFALNRLDTPALASQDNPRFADAVVASQTQPAQPTTIGETSVPPAVAPTISANTAMAEANRAVALRVSRAIASGEDTLTIELHPAELGHVAVHLAFHGSSVEVQMVVGRQETFQAFTQDRAALEQQFSQAGIDLGAGGLDLRYSRTPEPKQGYASGPSQSEAGFVEPQASKVFSTDNLVNIVA